jgi:DNA-binding response OmpR family regulator
MSSNPDNHSTRKSVLVVDDDPSVREILARVLAEEGYEVLTAGDGPEAFKIATQARIDLVLLDLNMPCESGWDTFVKLTTLDPLLAVMIVTARPNQIFTSLAAGVGALVEKPLNYPKLLETIRALLAEPAQTRLARLTGQATDFRYLSSAGSEPSTPESL